MSDTAFIIILIIISLANMTILIWSEAHHRLQARRERRTAEEHLEERRQLVIRGEQELRKQAQAVAAVANAAIHEIQTEDRLREPKP